MKLWREGREVARRLARGAHVDGLAVAQDEQLVELAEDLRRRLVDRRDHHTPAGRHLRGWSSALSSRVALARRPSRLL